MQSYDWFWGLPVIVDILLDMGIHNARHTHRDVSVRLRWKIANIL